jgi:hypothetical protein
MNGKKRPDGRKSVLAQAALATLAEGEAREREAVSLPALGFASLWRDAHSKAIRLIDLERRARFARVAN